jgi:hypothetical protein
MTTLMDGRMVRILVAPAKAGGKAYLKVVTTGFSVFTSAITRSSARRCCRTSRSSSPALETMFGGFRERAQTTYDLLKSPARSSSWSPPPSATRCARRPTSSSAREESMPLAGLVVNRVHRSRRPPCRPSARCRRPSSSSSRPRPAERALAAGVLRLHAQRMSLSLRERRLQERFSGAHPGVPVVEVAALPGDVHDLDGLRTVGADLAGAREATAPTG